MRKLLSISPGIVELAIDGQSISEAQMAKYLKELPTAQLKTLSLINFNRLSHDTLGCFSRLFRHHGQNYIMRVLAAIQRNPYIETLTLGREFTSLYKNEDDKDNRYFVTFNNFLYFRSLKELIIDNWGWEPRVFNSLQTYLTDPNCKLEILELKRGLNADEIKKLKEVMERSPSLKTYRGPAQEEIQPLLNVKNSTLYPTLS